MIILIIIIGIFLAFMALYSYYNSVIDSLLVRIEELEQAQESDDCEYII